MWYTDSNNQSGDCQHNHFSALTVSSHGCATMKNNHKEERQTSSNHVDLTLGAEPEEKNPYLHPVLVIQSDSDARSTTDQKHKRNTSYSNNNNNNKRGLCPYMQTFTRLSLNIITSKQQQIQKHIFFAIMLQFNLLCNMCG